MNKKISTYFEKRAGFTLVEMLIVMIISSLILVSIILIYEQYKIEVAEQTTREDLFGNKKAISMLGSFKANPQFARYPCPSDRSLGINDPAFGFEYGTNPADPTDIDPSTGLQLIKASCNLAGVPANGCTPSGGFCRVTNGATTTLIGGIPMQTLIKARTGTTTIGGVTFDVDLGQSHDYKLALDGWGNQYSYAVTFQFTDRTTAGVSNGTINALDEYGRQTAGFAGDAEFVVLSHGHNGVGAFNASGARTFPCVGATPATDGFFNENDNCDDSDNMFVQAYGQTDTGGNSSYDDFVYFSKVENSSLWTTVNDPNDPNRNAIGNLNLGFIGINTNNPQQMLDVERRDPITPAAIRMDNGVRVRTICDRAGNNCFDTELFTQPGVQCPVGQVLQGFRIDPISGGILGGTPTCVPVSITSFIPRTCTGWMVGVRTDGRVICSED